MVRRGLNRSVAHRPLPEHLELDVDLLTTDPGQHRRPTSHDAGQAQQSQDGPEGEQKRLPAVTDLHVATSGETTKGMLISHPRANSHR